jgi:hypothetical protein
MPPMAKTAEAHRAHAAVRYALQTGKLSKPPACENPECGAETDRLEAAHDDYADKLAVRWLCVPCHRAWDAARPKGGTVASKAGDVPILDGLVDRIVEFRRVPAADILGNDWNWRTHGDHQQAAVEESLADLGIYDPLKVYVRADGTYCLVDGHLRQKLIHLRLGPDTLVPVVVTDLTEDEARRALLTHDPLGALAGADPAKLEQLMREAGAGGEATQQMLKGLAEQNSIDWAAVQGGLDAANASLQESAAPAAPGEFPAVDESIETAYCCPRCSYRWSGNPNAANATAQE